MNCPCGHKRTFIECCYVIHQSLQEAKSAEQLMRARFSAFAKQDIEFLSESLATEKRSDFDKLAAGEWASSSDWKELRILRTEKGTEIDDVGMVEFEAHYSQKGKAFVHREVSQFKKRDGCWYYVEGRLVAAPEIGRNDPCPCGSGKKFKKCCLQS